MNSDIKGNVVLGFGPQDLDWFAKVAKVCGKQAVVCPDTARMAGANMAAGTHAALAALRERLAAGALHAQKLATPGLSPQAAEWLATGERGLSSESIFQHLTGMQMLGARQLQHPYDPSDLRRCRLLLEQVPELQQLFRERMAAASAEWAALVRDWDNICTAMDMEWPSWRTPKRGDRAPATYQLIKTAIGR